MFKLTLKLVALVMFVMLTVELSFAGSTALAWVSGGVVLLIGLLSLDREVALGGDWQNPPFLPMLTAAALMGPLAASFLFPEFLHAIGVRHSASVFDHREMLISALVGAWIALYLWIPFFTYWVIDAIFVRLDSREDRSV